MDELFASERSSETSQPESPQEATCDFLHSVREQQQGDGARKHQWDIRVSRPQGLQITDAYRKQGSCSDFRDGSDDVAVGALASLIQINTRGQFACDSSLLPLTCFVLETTNS